ncbi:glycosyltransferase [Winogradskyella bathintestinalis]|uniref:Glycosyltransferase n=1 Tax=Winogradskyella bathintestinalis TaxID=3035208 RepID=A0ABT7ZTR5_9FLAO|nr:glycosyltransferase [Winogradskyella bathintestinalis]MDN3492409.1 glycosyltransferase [Winogradskyella bathintestinalis]
MSILTIISHTEHYKSAEGSIVGLGSTVTELNHLVTVFDEIRHVAMLHQGVAPASALPYTSEKITFIPITAVGGSTLRDKFGIIRQAFNTIGVIRRSLKGSDYFQFRAPTGIGVFIIPYLILFTSKKGWFKYAGNWKQPSAPLAYQFQKWLLINQSRPVTINGFWDKQHKHCLSFENPCLTQKEIASGQRILTSKHLEFPLELCFVGRMENAKGVDLILKSLKSLNDEARLKIGVVHLVGSGTQMHAYRNAVEALSLPVMFHGYLSRTEVHDIYKRSHAILLPSASEGFPKVIAEAMNYGCVPIVSNVSSISHYIKDKTNGFLMTDITVPALNVCLLNLLDMDKRAYSQMISVTGGFISAFSYAHYNQRLLTDIL